MKLKLEAMLYQIKNWKSHWRAFYIGSYVVVEGVVSNMLQIGMGGVGRYYGTLGVIVHRANGSSLNLGCVSKRVVTTAFVNYLRDDLANAAGAADVSTFRFHGCGTGAVAEAIGDTALGAESTTALNPDSTRAVGTQVNSVAKTYSSVGTLTFDAVAAITEHGLFSAATVGVLMDRSVFAAVNVASGDSIQFTYTLTIADGG